jgi:hypothetical protein
LTFLSSIVVVNSEDNSSLTNPALLEKQLRAFAKEPHDLHLKKKQRQELTEDKIVLDYKLKELSAINAMFQQHLERRRSVEEALPGMVLSLRTLLPLTSVPDLRHELQRLLDEANAALGLPKEPPADWHHGPPKPSSCTSPQESSYALRTR